MLSALIADLLDGLDKLSGGIHLTFGPFTPDPPGFPAHGLLPVPGPSENR